MPHQRDDGSTRRGWSIGPTLKASSHDSAPEYGSWTCSRDPPCGSNCLKAVKGGARPTNSVPSGSAQSAASATVATQPTLKSAGGGGRSAGGQPGGGGPDGPTDSASTQA